MSASCGSGFKIIVLSPSEVLLQEEIFFVVVPGEEGELGILVNHMPLITTLKAGMIKVYKKDQAIISWEKEVSAGIMEVRNNMCQVLIPF